MVTADVAGTMRRASGTLMAANQWIWLTNAHNRLSQQVSFNLSLSIKNFTGVWVFVGGWIPKCKGQYS